MCVVYCCVSCFLASSHVDIDIVVVMIALPLYVSLHPCSSVDQTSDPYALCIAEMKMATSSSGAVGWSGAKENTADATMCWHFVLAHTAFTPEWALKVRRALSV